MTKGSWYYIVDEKLFEFHANQDGMVDCTKFSGFNRFVYLEKDVRVVVFPVESNEQNPYVDHTKRSSEEEDPNCQVIFENPNNDMSLSDMNEAFSAKVKEVFGDDKEVLSALHQKWNKLPIYYPNLKNSSTDSFENRF
jgi:hypothetical protein